jgi:hypothetical protein
MKNWIIFALMSLGLVQECEASKSVDLSQGDTRAISMAMTKFSMDGYSLDGYSLSLNDDGKEIEVIFVPPLKGGSDPIQAALPSGKPEIHYFFDMSGTRFIKRLDGQ